VTQPIDTAYVDIVVRDKSLDKLQKDIDRSLDKIEKDVQKDLDKIDKDFDDAFDEIDKHFANMVKDAEKSFDELTEIVEDSTDAIDAQFNHVFSRSKKHFKDLSDDADSSFRRIRRRFQEPLQDALTSIGRGISNVGTMLGQLGSSVGGVVSSSPLLILIAVLTPAIIALAGALLQLVGVIGLIPAGITVLLATFIPMCVAFQNFGTAIGAIMSGDVDKINEALKKLAPNARIVAQEFAELVPQLKTFQLTTQNAFFKPLIGAMTQLGKSTLPALENGFLRSAAAMGGLLRQVLDFLSLPEQATFIDNLFKTTARLVTSFGPNLVKFMAGFLEVANAALPTLERLGGAFSTAFGKFGDFMAESAANGSLQKFIDDALTTARELFDLVKALSGLLGTLFAGTEDAGHSFIVSLTEMIIRLDEFLKTADGKTVIDALVLSTEALATSLGLIVEITIFLVRAFKNALKMFEAIGRGVVSLALLIGEWFTKAKDTVTTTIGQIPEIIGEVFQRAIDTALMILGVGIGTIIFIFTELPNQIAGFLLSLPQRIYAIFLQIGPLIGLALQGAVDFGRNIIVNGFNEIVDFVMSVPERLKGLIPTFSGAGKNLIQSFMNGFRSVGNFIGDVAGDIVGAVKGFLNKAIDKINVGIAKVDEVLPGDLGRIPRLAGGAFVSKRPGGILANVGEGNEDEWVLPQSKLEALAGGTMITFGPGAINVNFSGALPTEKEAQSIGETIGSSMANAIVRRNLRTQVRAI
jgi:phage-related protein